MGFGLIPSNFRESTGDTIGGFGGAIAIKRGTWTAQTNGTFTGILVVHPDRGFNVYVLITLLTNTCDLMLHNSDGTIDYQARRHELSFALTPYTSTTNLNFTFAQTTFEVTYLNTTLEYERNNTRSSGLDPTAIRGAQSGYPRVPSADPQMPIASIQEPHLTLDIEGIVLNTDGS